MGDEKLRWGREGEESCWINLEGDLCGFKILDIFAGSYKVQKQ